MRASEMSGITIRQFRCSIGAIAIPTDRSPQACGRTKAAPYPKPRDGNLVSLLRYRRPRHG